MFINSIYFFWGNQLFCQKTELKMFFVVKLVNTELHCLKRAGKYNQVDKTGG